MGTVEAQHCRETESHSKGDFNNLAPKFASRSSSADLYGMETKASMLEKESVNTKRASMAAGELHNAPNLGKDWNVDESRKSDLIQDKPTIRGPRLFAGMGSSLAEWLHWRRIIFFVFGSICW